MARKPHSCSSAQSCSAENSRLEVAARSAFLFVDDGPCYHGAQRNRNQSGGHLRYSCPGHHNPNRVRSSRNGREHSQSERRTKYADHIPPTKRKAEVDDGAPDGGKNVG